jgi:hypothetical protein
MAAKRLNPLENAVKVKALSQGVMNPVAADGLNVNEAGGPTKYARQNLSGKGKKMAGSKGGKSTGAVKRQEDIEKR